MEEETMNRQNFFKKFLVCNKQAKKNSFKSVKFVENRNCEMPLFAQKVVEDSRTIPAGYARHCDFSASASASPYEEVNLTSTRLSSTDTIVFQTFIEKCLAEIHGELDTILESERYILNILANYTTNAFSYQHLVNALHTHGKHLIQVERDAKKTEVSLLEHKLDIFKNQNKKNEFQLKTLNIFIQEKFEQTNRASASDGETENFSASDNLLEQLIKNNSIGVPIIKEEYDKLLSENRNLRRKIVYLKVWVQRLIVDNDESLLEDFIGKMERQDHCYLLQILIRELANLDAIMRESKETEATKLHTESLKDLIDMSRTCIAFIAHTANAPERAPVDKKKDNMNEVIISELYNAKAECKSKEEAWERERREMTKRIEEERKRLEHSQKAFQRNMQTLVDQNAKLLANIRNAKDTIIEHESRSAKYKADRNLLEEAQVLIQKLIKKNAEMQKLSTKLLDENCKIKAAALYNKNLGEHLHTAVDSRDELINKMKLAINDMAVRQSKDNDEKVTLCSELEAFVKEKESLQHKVDILKDNKKKMRSLVDSERKILRELTKQYTAVRDDRNKLADDSKSFDAKVKELTTINEQLKKKKEISEEKCIQLSETVKELQKKLLQNKTNIQNVGMQTVYNLCCSCTQTEELFFNNYIDLVPILKQNHENRCASCNSHITSYNASLNGDYPSSSNPSISSAKNKVQFHKVIKICQVDSFCSSITERNLSSSDTRSDSTVTKKSHISLSTCPHLTNLSYAVDSQPLLTLRSLSYRDATSESDTCSTAKPSKQPATTTTYSSSKVASTPLVQVYEKTSFLAQSDRAEKSSICSAVEKEDLSEQSFVSYGLYELRCDLKKPDSVHSEVIVKEAPPEPKIIMVDTSSQTDFVPEATQEQNKSLQEQLNESIKAHQQSKDLLSAQTRLVLELTQRNCELQRHVENNASTIKFLNADNENLLMQLTLYKRTESEINLEESEESDEEDEKSEEKSLEVIQLEQTFKSQLEGIRMEYRILLEAAEIKDFNIIALERQCDDFQEKVYGLEQDLEFVTCQRNEDLETYNEEITKVKRKTTSVITEYKERFQKLGKINEITESKIKALNEMIHQQEEKRTWLGTRFMKCIQMLVDEKLSRETSQRNEKEMLKVVKSLELDKTQLQQSKSYLESECMEYKKSAMDLMKLYNLMQEKLNNGQSEHSNTVQQLFQLKSSMKEDSLPECDIECTSYTEIELKPSLSLESDSSGPIEDRIMRLKLELGERENDILRLEKQMSLLENKNLEKDFEIRSLSLKIRSLDRVGDSTSQDFPTDEEN